jgi:hypothetical protein
MSNSEFRFPGCMSASTKVATFCANSGLYTNSPVSVLKLAPRRSKLKEPMEHTMSLLHFAMAFYAKYKVAIGLLN